MPSHRESWRHCLKTHIVRSWHFSPAHLAPASHIFTCVYIPEKVGDESRPPNNCCVAKSTRRHTFGCFLYTRAAACIQSSRICCPITLPEAELNIHVRTAAMGCIWARVGQLNRLPRGTWRYPRRIEPWLFHCQKQNWKAMPQFNGYGLYLGSGSSQSRRLSASNHDCSIARSRIEQPW